MIIQGRDGKDGYETRGTMRLVDGKAVLQFDDPREAELFLSGPYKLDDGERFLNFIVDSLEMSSAFVVLPEEADKEWLRED